MDFDKIFEEEDERLFRAEYPDTTESNISLNHEKELEVQEIKSHW